jgi:hypothetical protein
MDRVDAPTLGWQSIWFPSMKRQRNVKATATHFYETQLPWESDPAVFSPVHEGHLARWPPCLATTLRCWKCGIPSDLRRSTRVGGQRATFRGRERFPAIWP